MLLLLRQRGLNHLTPISQKIPSLYLSVASKSSITSPETRARIDEITRIINNHPFPDQPLHPTLLQHLPPPDLSSDFVENVLGRLFAGHSNGLKVLEFFNFALHHSKTPPTADAFEKTIHILARMRYFDKAWDLMIEIRKKHPSLLTLKSMSIMISKIAKFQSYEETLDSFRKMETEVFTGREFGTDEFNLLILAFSSLGRMKEARSVFQKLHSRFTPTTKTMNILLLGFKQVRDITAMELFYHEMVKRGFKPDNVSYNIRIDAYCKKKQFGDALRLFEEMEKMNCFPTIETITTLIHGAGVARNTEKARQMFDEMSKRKLQPDIGAYNALISTLIKSRDMNSAVKLMEEMEEKKIGHDNMTYHTMFLGMMKMKGVDGVCEFYERMVAASFIPETRTVVMLMKYFLENRRVESGLSLWNYVVEKGCCPHSHALDILVTGLCSRGRWKEAFECSTQMLERGRHMSESAYRMLQQFLCKFNETEKMREMDEMIMKLQSALPLPSGDLVVKKDNNFVLSKLF